LIKLKPSELRLILDGDSETVKKYKKVLEPYNPKACKYCGEEFSPSIPTQIYCSISCSTTAFARNNPDKMREYKRNWARKARQS
jgi:hypothetical protein